ncbi:hypothetical protein CDAR_254761 [Caerostris darwini]|uniref:Uncharacterized protein n=1 Tax=Caerostris darwini TaxID=1538125 RepID=A0AAV4TEH0_9ARAC|nr:hypothetical protein CDAR_254761 [Caerostris darwini]
MNKRCFIFCHAYIRSNTKKNIYIENISSPSEAHTRQTVTFQLFFSLYTYLSPLKKSLPYQRDATERKTLSYEAHHHTTTLPSYDNLAHNITSLTQNSYQPLFRAVPKRAGKKTPQGSH